jgi:HEAT repeat protein
MSIFKPNLDKLEQTGDLDKIIQYLYHNKADVRLNAFSILLKKGHKLDAAVMDRCKVLIDDPDFNVRIVAILKFAEMGEEGIYDKLESVLLNGSQSNKIDALRILAHRGKGESEVLSKMLVLALNDKKELVQIEAIRTMGALKDKLSVLHIAQKVHDSKSTLRLECVRALGKIASDDAVDSLIGALLDDNTNVRLAAREALYTMDSEKARKALKDEPLMLLVKLMNESVAKRLEIVQYVGKHKRSDALPLLHTACNDEYKNIRLEAVKSLGQLRNHSSFNFIIKMLDDPYFDVRQEAVRTLEKFPDQIALKAIEKAFNDKNKHVRDEAKKCHYSLQQRIEIASKRTK